MLILNSHSSKVLHNAEIKTVSGKSIIDISRKAYEKNGVEIVYSEVYRIVYSEEILCLNKEHVEERLGHKGLRMITVKCRSEHRKHR